MDQTKNYYSILGVLPTAEPVVIRAAYRALSMKYHPDKWSGDKATAERMMRELNEAYEVLSDEQLRNEYDGRRKKDGVEFSPNLFWAQQRDTRFRSHLD